MITRPLVTSNDLPTVAIVGRVNVGKSTLFNHVTDSHHAFISSEPGTTRTRNVAAAHWRGYHFNVVDTGGLTFEKTTQFEKEISNQVDVALAETDVIIFLVDLKTNPIPAEQQLARKLLKSKKPIIFVGNKADNNRLAERTHEHAWRTLKCGVPLAISASTGRGVGDLLDRIVEQPAMERGHLKRPHVPKDTIKVALIGKPNVGKSSLFNALIGQDRVVVSDIPHTTRETHDLLFNWKDNHFLFIDTAGVRRKANIERGLELQGVRQSLETIKEADIILFVVDATGDVTHQDKALAGMIEEAKKPIIIVANKWDKAQAHIDDGLRTRGRTKSGEDKKPEELFRDYLSHHFKFVAFAPIIFVSAKTHERVETIFPELLAVNVSRATQLDPHALEDAFKQFTSRHHPVRGKGVRHPKIYSIKQISNKPPVFELAVKRNTNLHDSYLRYIEHELRKEFGFEGVPMVFYIKKKTL